MSYWNRVAPRVAEKVVSALGIPESLKAIELVIAESINEAISYKMRMLASNYLLRLNNQIVENAKLKAELKKARNDTQKSILKLHKKIRLNKDAFNRGRAHGLADAMIVVHNVCVDQGLESAEFGAALVRRQRELIDETKQVHPCED